MKKKNEKENKTMARKSRYAAYAQYMTSKKTNKVEAALAKEASIMKRIEKMKKEAAETMKKGEN